MQASVASALTEENSVRNMSPKISNPYKDPYKAKPATGITLNGYFDTAESVTQSIDTIASQLLPPKDDLPLVSIRSQSYPTLIMISHTKFPGSNCLLCHQPLEPGYSIQKFFKRKTGRTNWCCLDCNYKHRPIEEKHHFSPRQGYYCFYPSRSTNLFVKPIYYKWNNNIGHWKYIHAELVNNGHGREGGNAWEHNEIWIHAMRSNQKGQSLQPRQSRYEQNEEEGHEAQHQNNGEKETVSNCITHTLHPDYLTRNIPSLTYMQPERGSGKNMRRGQELCKSSQSV